MLFTHKSRGQLSLWHGNSLRFEGNLVECRHKPPLKQLCNVVIVRNKESEEGAASHSQCAFAY